MLDTSQHPKLPAGLVDNGVEFFVHENEVKCIHNGQRFIFPDFPQHILDIIQDDMLSHPEAIKALAEWTHMSQMDRIRQYIYCRFGGFDNEPDIDANGKIHHAEYYDCGARGTCKAEGKLCCSVKVSNGYITKTELEVIKRIAKSYKVIADDLFISPETVSSHIQNIMKKTGLAGKVELAIFATQKGII